MSAPNVNTSISPDIIKGATAEKRIHKIPDFLNRYYQIDSFNWQKSDTRGTVLKTYRFPDTLLSDPTIRSKISNFYGLRAGVQFTILVNSQKFQAGNLMISFLPNAKYNNAKRAVHLSDFQGMVSRSGSPRTNLDLMDGTRATLTVPYASPFTFYNLLTDEGTIGDFHISVYSVLQDVASAGTVSVSVYARFVDVDLEFPTGQLPMTKHVQMPTLRNITDTLAFAPSRAKLNEAYDEIRSILYAIDQGRFSFQMNTEASGFKQKALPKMASSDDNNLTHMLSTHSDNSLAPMNMGETSSDEMSLSHISSIPCYYSHFSISKSQAIKTNVWTTNVTPLVPANTNPDLSLSVDYLYANANLFRKWRGSIIYSFRAVKTCFHSVRIRVWFSPGSSSPVNIDRNTIYSKIVDLEVNNTFTFEVPWVHPFNYLNTRGSTGVSLGLLGVDIENPMVSPDTVVDNIEIVVDRCGGSDFQLVLPQSLTEFPFNPTPVVTTNFRYQMNTESSSSADVKMKLSRPTYEMSHGIISTAWLLSDIPWYRFFPAVLFVEIACCVASSLYNYFVRFPFKKDLTKEGIHPNPGPSIAQTGSSSSEPINFTSPFLGVQKLQLSLSSDGFVPTNPNPVVETYQMRGSPYTFTCQNAGFVYINAVYTSAQSTLLVDGTQTLLVYDANFISRHTPVYVEAGSHTITSSGNLGVLTVSIYPIENYPVGGINFDVSTPNGVLTVTDPVYCLPGAWIPNADNFAATVIVNGISSLYNTSGVSSAFFGTGITYLGPGQYPVQFSSFGSVVGTARIGFALTGALPTLAMSSSKLQPLIPVAPYTSAIVDSSGQFSGNLTTGGPYVINFDRNNLTPSLTFTPTTTTQYDLIWSTDTNNSFHYQMDRPEQDIERGGMPNDSLTNPLICTNLSKYCIGNSIENIKQMIQRSTLFDKVPIIDSRSIHIFPHAFGICDKDDEGLVTVKGTDNLSYFANYFSFARGSVNFRLQMTGAPYRVLINPSNDIDQTPNQVFNLIEQSGNGISTAELIYSSNLIQQSINTGVEGFGEFAIPFYSSTYCYNINPQYSLNISKEVAEFSHPDTHLLIFPQGNLTDLVAFRNAGPDFEFSYLSGPPILYPITS